MRARCGGGAARTTTSRIEVAEHALFRVDPLLDVVRQVRDARESPEPRGRAVELRAEESSESAWQVATDILRAVTVDPPMDSRPAPPRTEEVGSLGRPKTNPDPLKPTEIGKLLQRPKTNPGPLMPVELARPLQRPKRRIPAR